jgi:hypothetical protein
LGGVPCDPTNRRAIAARSELDAGGGPFTASACECARNHASSSGTGTHDHPPELRVFFFRVFVCRRNGAKGKIVSR